MSAFFFFISFLRNSLDFHVRKLQKTNVYYPQKTDKQANLDIILYDSEGNLVEELDQAKERVTYLTMHYDDTYTLAAE